MSAAQQKIVHELLELRDALNADPDFVLYKTLIGHDSVRPTAWDEHPFNPDATRKWRAESYPAILAAIKTATVDEWIERIRRYIAEPKQTGGELESLADCLKLLGGQKPEVAARFLDAMDDVLAPLLVSLLLGLEKSGNEVIARLAIGRWIGQGRFLAHLGDYLRWRDAFDPDTLIAVVNRSIEFANTNAVLSSLNAAAHRFDTTPDKRLIDDVVMPAIGYLTDVKMMNWVGWAWGLQRGGLLGALGEAQSHRVVGSFVDVPELDYGTDQVLTIVANRFPSIVFDFLETRINRERGDRRDHFDPIPHQLHQLQEPLSREPAMLLDAARKWYARDPHFNEFRGGRLIGLVFPKLTQDVLTPLAEVVKAGDRTDLDFVLTTLLAYDGDDQVYPLCMEVVDRLAEGDDWLSRVTSVLGKKGIVRGEFGWVEAEAAQRVRLEAWRDDPRPKVQAYVRNQIRQIDQSMAWEQRRAERDIEQRKRDWGEA